MLSPPPMHAPALHDAGGAVFLASPPLQQICGDGNDEFRGGIQNLLSRITCTRMPVPYQLDTRDRPSRDAADTREGKRGKSSWYGTRRRRTKRSEERRVGKECR